MFAAVITTNDLPNLAREINDAHRQVRMHAKGMLLEAKRAGEALLVAKQQCVHGEFEAWVKAHTGIGQSTAREYMRVAKLGKTMDLQRFEGGIRAFLDAHAEPKRRSAVLPPFTRPDAEYAMKLHRMAEGTANENEAAVAKAKLEQHAANHGMTAEQVVEKSRKELGLDWIEEKQQFGPYAQAAAQLIEKNLGKKRSDELVQLIIKVLVNHPETLATLKDYLK